MPCDKACLVKYSSNSSARHDWVIQYSWNNNNVLKTSAACWFQSFFCGLLWTDLIPCEEMTWDWTPLMWDVAIKIIKIGYPLRIPNLRIDPIDDLPTNTIQWELQDPKMEVLYHTRPYFVGIFPYIGLYGSYLQFRFLKWPLIYVHLWPAKNHSSITDPIHL